LAADAGCALPALIESGDLRRGDMAVTCLGRAVYGAGGRGILTWDLGADAWADALNTGTVRLAPPLIFRVEGQGVLRPGVFGVDVGLYLAAQFGPGGAAGAAVEYVGPWAGPRAEGLAEALGLAGPEMVMCGGEEGGAADAVWTYDFTALTPQYAAPAGSGYAVESLADARDRFVGCVVIGTAAGADDLAAAAAVLEGRKVHSDVDLWVIPATRRDMLTALNAGSIATLIAAGANVIPWCGVFPFRCGAGEPAAVTSLCMFDGAAADGTEVYFVNPAAAAAAALESRLTDPTPLCGRS
jgi:homoaconitase/3-isopropylmalate dehydratase large subunit